MSVICPLTLCADNKQLKSCERYFPFSRHFYNFVKVIQRCFCFSVFLLIRVSSVQVREGQPPSDRTFTFYRFLFCLAFGRQDFILNKTPYRAKTRANDFRSHSPATERGGEGILLRRLCFCGQSAQWESRKMARPTPIRSAAPSSKSAWAWARVVTPPVRRTGICTACLAARDISWKYPGS